MDTQNYNQKLIGWLVSYGLDERGAAFEIRSGRGLVTSGREAAPGTISLQDDSVSSPHLAINATQKNKVLVQDVFSAQGSYLMRNGSQEEIPVTGPVEVKHGDWLRLGATVRFQVCLINRPM